MSPALTAPQPATTLNGLDTEKMVETVAALKANPTLAKFEFRARNRWISGGENRSTIKGFYGAGAEDVSRHEAFEFTNGEPPVLLGDNEGANPVEFLLHALAGCVTTTTVLHAAARGIEIDSLSTRLVGDIDLQGLLALGDVPAGYQRIRVHYLAVLALRRNLLKSNIPVLIAADELRVIMNADPPISFCIALSDFERPVGATVIDDAILPILIGLG